MLNLGTLINLYSIQIVHTTSEDFLLALFSVFTAVGASAISSSMNTGEVVERKHNYYFNRFFAKLMLSSAPVSPTTVICFSLGAALILAHIDSVALL